MSQRRRPKRGSRAYGPRKRAQSQTPRLDSWPEIAGAPKIQGFAGYKAGMTHAFIVDKRAKSTTSGMELQVPVTVLEVPPMKVAAVRFYENTVYGLKTAGEVWANDLDPLLAKRLSVPKNHDEASFAKYDGVDVEDVRVLAYTQPKLVKGVPKKVPDLMELRIGGLSHKNSKHRRGIGNLGPKRPGYVRGTVPGSGQLGYHQRTEFNKQLMKIGAEGAEITPKGGFLNYGEVTGAYVLVHGSVPGPAKRLVRFRDPIRLAKGADTEAANITYISTESKQGA